MKTILIVDDDPDFAEAIAAFLRANEFCVLEARDGAEGLRLARLVHPDLVIMDIVMRERTEGLFAVQEIRRTPELKDVPVFVLTSLYSTYPEFGVAPESGWLAHDEFFTKPVDMNVMLAKIRQHLRMEESVV
jgi:two-component system alkaline phosphatase synthesis response regulator PhoP